MQTFRQADARCDNAAGQLVNKVVKSNELVINLIDKIEQIHTMKT